MKLTGKAKEDFEKWLHEKRYFIISVEDDFLAIWDNCSDSMQYGVLVDWFDSVGIDISMSAYNGAYWYDIEPSRYVGDELVTRQEARTQAIIKANEIYND